ncbi:MAG: secondary thiamine-phosphate synthase enzyme YjbQ [Candidatus Moranbacteria bacterium]|nr:secondary thiamine-phosphate synthase enzyme YjbQ [Candidatus Moranbacteria bacterium]
MKTVTQMITFSTTTSIDFVDITQRIQEVIEGSAVRQGLVIVFAPHTTMGVVINHNEPMLLQDFSRMLTRLVPVEDQYSHDLFELRRGVKTDGRSNGHSHCKRLLLSTSETIPVERGRMQLSNIQSVFAVELDGGRERSIVVTVMGQ